MVGSDDWVVGRVGVTNGWLGVMIGWLGGWDPMGVTNGFVGVTNRWGSDKWVGE